MRAAVFHGAGDIRLTHVPTPAPRAGEVLVRVGTAGICGSDVNRFRYGSHPWPPPFIMGHEFCGEIADVGADVRDWKTGDRVVVQPTLGCGTCVYCRAGRENLCVEFATRGLTGSGTDGAFAEFVRVPAYQPHRWPSSMPPSTAALTEPLAVGVHGIRLAARAALDTVVVIGIGNIGLLAIVAARARGARRIVAIGKYRVRADIARAYGASDVIAPDDPALAERVLAATDGLGAELVLEAAGTPSSLRMAVACARKAASIVVLGVLREEAALDYRRIVMHEQSLHGSIIYCREDFTEAVDILSRTAIDPRHVTATIALDEILSRGFGPLTTRPADFVKVQLTP